MNQEGMTDEMTTAPWFDSYPPGTPHFIPESSHQSLDQWLLDSCQKYANQIAFSQMGTDLLYSQLAGQSRNFAAFLQQHCKLKKGERVAIMMPNVLPYPVVNLGILRAGLVVVNINPLYTTPELLYVLKDSGVKAILVFEKFAHTLQQVLDQTDIEQVIVVRLGDLLPVVKSCVANAVLKWVLRQVPAYAMGRSTRFTEALKIGEQLTLAPVHAQKSDIAYLQYTGGTTGKARAVMLTHGNLIANLQQILAWITPPFQCGKEILVTALPLYHIFSLTTCHLLGIVSGSQCLLIIDARDRKQLTRVLAKHRFTIFIGVSTLYHNLLDYPPFHQLDFSHLRITIGGGMAVQTVVAQRWQALTGVPLIEGYGLTEASPVIAVNRLDLPAYNGMIGLPLPSTEISIRNDQGISVPIGDVGELWVKGPQVMSGYWHREEETKQALAPEGWLRTGDMAVMDKAGYFKIVDRKKELIIVSGFNVYPSEVEKVVLSCPGVAEAAVVGVPDEHSGEAVKLFVVRSDSSLTEDQIQSCCAESLTPYKRPRMIVFVDHMPKSSVGKVLKRALVSGK